MSKKLHEVCVLLINVQTEVLAGLFVTIYNFKCLLSVFLTSCMNKFCLRILINLFPRNTHLEEILYL